MDEVGAPRLIVTTWWWRNKYSLDYLLRLRAGVLRHLKQDHRFLCMTERERFISLPENVERHAIKDPCLTERKGCFARLRLFDPGWQKNRGIRPGDRVVNLDLDLIVTGALDQVLDRDEDLIVLQGVNAVNPCPYNCSVFMFRAGTHAHLWQDFAAMGWADGTLRSAMPVHEFPDDQGWLWQKAPHAAAFTPQHGVYAFQKPGWPGGTNGENIPVDARIIAFPGGRDPAHYTRLGWVRQHWLGIGVQEAA